MLAQIPQIMIAEYKTGEHVYFSVLVQARERDKQLQSVSQFMKHIEMQVSN